MKVILASKSPRRKELMDLLGIEYEIIVSEVDEILEEIDFKNPNIDNLDIEKNIKEKINLFLESDIIKENINSNFYKEYEFLYKESNIYSHGIIDLMIESDTEIIIVDYKLKNIDDINYDNQLNGYRNAISKKSSKPIKCYLYSILNNKFREI